MGKEKVHFERDDQGQSGLAAAQHSCLVTISYVGGEKYKDGFKTQNLFREGILTTKGSILRRKKKEKK